MVSAFGRRVAVVCGLLAGLAASVFAQAPGGSAGAQPADPSTAFNEQIVVVGITPLPGLELPSTQVPSPVQTATASDIRTSGALDITAFLNRQFTGVHINETQNNPFQPDVSYRGYTASPLLGTPQGLSVYVDGVRFNQPFGDVVSWDSIPKIAIGSTTLMPGSNPLFGLNTLGGALVLQTKDGRTAPGTTVEATYGSSVRRSVEVEHGGQSASRRLHWYLAGTLFGEDGWRDDSPSDVRQLFGKIGWVRDRGGLVLSGGQSVNSLNGNGLQDVTLLDRDYSSIYTKPDTTDNRSTLVTVAGERKMGGRLQLNANAYYRDLHAETLNGDVNDDSLDQSLYQPTARERAALAAAGYTGVPASGLDASNTPFPSLRCIANGLLNDEPAKTCNGLINRTTTSQHTGGASGQLVQRGTLAGRENRLTVGGGIDRSGVEFDQTSELGYVNPDRSITGIGAFGDGGVTGGEVEGEPYDTRIALSSTVTTWSLFGTDTLPLGTRAHLTLSGRYDHTSIDNRDQITPGGGSGSLDGRHTFARFNPSAGGTIDVTRRLNAYAGYSEGSRAATSIELGCADPDTPCKLPNAMAGDPALDQVVTRTVEAGARGSYRQLAWNAGWFRGQNDNDILFVMSQQTGFGYFRNFGRTRREGIEVGGRGRHGRLTGGAGYTWLRATFESEETVNGASNSENDAAASGQPGLEGAITIAPGNRLPFVPAQTLKLYGQVAITSRIDLDADLIAAGTSYARGNENNAHEPDGVYYLGAGRVSGYVVMNLGVRYALNRQWQIHGQVNNLFDRRYATGAQLGPAGFSADGTFVSRPFPPVGAEYPLQHTTFVAPGAPLRGWIDLRVHF